MKTSHNPETLVLTFFERVWHAPHELEAIDELMTEDYVIYTAGTAVAGRERFKDWIRGFQTLLLDARTDSEDIFYNEAQNKVVSRWICSGRNNGIFGLPADGREVSFSGIAIWEVRNGRLARCWAERSAYELYQQLITTDRPGQFV